MPFAAPLADSGSVLARPDLAELGVEGLVPAAAYRALRPMRGLAAVCDVFDGSDRAAARISQLLHGEAFDVLDSRGGRLWGRCRRDGVVGWIDGAALAEGAPLATRWVSRPGGVLPLNALLSDDEPGGVETAAIGEFAADPAAVAESLLGVRHAAGGRSSVETDCAGLVQQALLACGLPGPRDTAAQARLGVDVGRAQARRGDLALWLHPEGGPGWTGHSGLMRDADTVIHATGHHKAVVIEPLAEVEARLRADGFSDPVFRRLGPGLI